MFCNLTEKNVTTPFGFALIDAVVQLTGEGQSCSDGFISGCGSPNYVTFR